MTRTDQFAKTYTACFAQVYPLMPEERRNTLTAKAIEVFPHNPKIAIIDSPAFKQTAKALGIKNTYKAWIEFFGQGAV